MFRPRIEKLESRRLFAVTDLVVDPFDAVSAASEAVDADGLILPYVEQDNLYKANPTVQGIADGSSNTLMFGETTRFVADVASVDVWEHAHSRQRAPEANGIIAILIGLTADPADPSGNTVDAASAAAADGAASLPGSDDLFARFTSTTLDDETLVATTYGRETNLSQLTHAQLTHDMEFEIWANKSRFNHADASSSFYDLLISSFRDNGENDPARTGESQRLIGSDGTWGNDVQNILHEENEFSIPRMITAARAS